MLNRKKIIYKSSRSDHRNSLYKNIVIAAVVLLWNTSAFCQTKATNGNNSKASSPGYKVIPIDQEKQQSDTLIMNVARPIPKGGMLKQYQKLFKTIHGKEQELMFSEAKASKAFIYDTLNNLYYRQLSNPNVLVPGATVFGWHPYWMTKASDYYPFSLLSTIAFFAYDVNEEDGSCYDQDAIKEWYATTLIDSAKKYNIKTLLTITSYGEDRNNVFLENKNAWAILGDSLLLLLRARSAQGIDIDFTGISEKKKDKFVMFVNSLRAKIGDTCIITLHITTRDLRSKGLDLTSLKYKANVNTFIIQGHDYESALLKSGALAPLYSRDKDCIVKLVEECLNKGLDSKDLVLNLPLFGNISSNKEYDEIAYNDIVAIYEKNYAHTIDPWSESARIIVGKAQDTIIWYESGESIYRKFRWAAEHNLQGVGLWGLGYDGGSPEVWKAVTENYGVKPVKEIFPISVGNGKIYPFIYKLQQYRKPIGIGIFIIAVFFIAGLLLSLLDWRVREIFFRGYINRALLSSLIIAMFIFALYCFNAESIKSDSIFLLVVGLALGGIIVYLTTRFYMTYRKKMP